MDNIRDGDAVATTAELEFDSRFFWEGFNKQALAIEDLGNQRGAVHQEGRRDCGLADPAIGGQISIDVTMRSDCVGGGTSNSSIVLN